MTEDDDSPGKQVALPPEDPAESQDDPRQYRLPLEDLIDVERQRIDSFNKRTELGHKAIEAQDAADKRQFDFHMRELDVRERQSGRQHGFARQIFWCGGSFIALCVALVLLMVFFGDPAQIETAKDILRVVGQALGGAGFLYLTIRAVRWMVTR